MNCIATILFAAVLGVLAAVQTHAAPVIYAGVNLSGGEYSADHLPGTYGTHYTYPTQSEVDYFLAKGMNTFRLTFLWERLQRNLNWGLDATELGRLNGFISAATSKGAFVILDPHNYARYGTNLIGSAQVPISAFSNFWYFVGAAYRTNDHVIFGLMNEPNGSNYPTETWRDAANAAILGIRNAGAPNLILVPGNAWTGAHSWYDSWYGTPNATAMRQIVDPTNNYAFEVHQYFDSDSSGTHPDCVSTNIGVDRLKNFTAWCRYYGKRSFLGEFGVATNLVCLQTLSNTLAYVHVNTDVWLGWSYWTAGPWVGEYMFTIEPTADGLDRPQMNVLEEFLPLLVPVLRPTSNSHFQYTATRGYVYQALCASDLSAAVWTNYGSVITGSNQTVTVPISPGSAASAFYRLSVRRAP